MIVVEQFPGVAILEPRRFGGILERLALLDELPNVIGDVRQIALFGL